MNLKILMRTASHHVTWFLGTRFPGTIPLVFVTGYPKSGTTWACQLVADYLRLPFPRFSLLPVGFPAAVQGHELVKARYPKGVYVLRDGRDVLVSQYFYMTRSIPEGDNPRLSGRQRRMFPGLTNKQDVRTNLPGFIQRQMRKPESSPANWGNHVRSYFQARNPNVVLLRYEDLLLEGAGALAEAMSRLTGEPADTDRAADSILRYSFRKLAGRQPGQEDRSSFMRKGQAGDWRNHFTREAAEIFDRHCGDMLIAAGYESDRAWVQSCEPALPHSARSVTDTQ